ncbi:hypothetical protein FJY70_03980, partial [candidate division WOR-3 bacterium]|nr:hypothetical protein [candidate division WOR-3 bacterium]
MTYHRLVLALLLGASLVAGVWAIPTRDLPARADQARGPVPELVDQTEKTQDVKPRSDGVDVYKVLLAVANINITDVATYLRDSSGGDFTCDTLRVQSYYLRNIDSLLAAGVRCIITWTNYTYINKDAIGDSLAKFVNLGGGAIVMVFADFQPTYNIGGAFATRYMPVPLNTNSYSSGTLGTVYVPGHPIMNRVDSVGCGNYKTGATTINPHNGYCTRVADWSGGQVQCAALDSAGRRVAFLGFYGNGRTVGGLTGRWCRQMVNAVRWVSMPPGRPGDVGCTRIIAPTGNVPYGSAVVPQAKVRNYSTVAQRFPVRMDIGTVYNNTKFIDSLLPGDSLTVSFDTWRVLHSGSFAIKCSTQLFSDTIQSNDKATGNCFVPLVDAGVRAILAPTGTIPYGTPVQPQARVKNF